eukprot:9862957-Alexandrium_andersonii.AAC.1
MEPWRLALGSRWKQRREARATAEAKTPWASPGSSQGWYCERCGESHWNKQCVMCRTCGWERNQKKPTPWVRTQPLGRWSAPQPKAVRQPGRCKPAVPPNSIKADLDLLAARDMPNGEKDEATQPMEDDEDEKEDQPLPQDIKGAVEVLKRAGMSGEAGKLAKNHRVKHHEKLDVNKRFAHASAHLRTCQEKVESAERR